MYQSRVTRNVLHVIAHMEKGGAERQLKLLTEASRHKNVILVLAGNEQPSSIPVERLPSLDPRSIYRTTRDVIRRYHIDIVQLWLPDRITIPAMFAARREGCIILSGDRRRVRNYGVGAVRDRLPYINHVFARRVLPNYPHLLHRLSLRKVLGIPGKTQTILNGLDLKICPASLGPKPPDRLLFVGRLVEQKRVGMLIDALPALIKRAGITHLDVVGEGPEEPDLRDRITKHALTGHVTLHGRLGNWGERFSPKTHMLVLPSTSEGMSNTLFEAMAWGFFPLVSQSPELDLILGDWSDKPAMFSPKHPDSLISAIARVRAAGSAELELQILAMQARLPEFSVAKMAETYDRLYEEISTEEIRS